MGCGSRAVLVAIITTTLAGCGGRDVGPGTGGPAIELSIEVGTADASATKAATSGIPADRVCTQVYGGPDAAHVTGRLRGQVIDTRFDRSNGCAIAEWDLLQALLGPPLWSDGVMPTYVDPAAAIHAKTGHRFAIVLESNATTGYQWQVTVSDDVIVRLVSQDYQAPSTELIGAGGHQVFELEAVGPGGATLNFEYLRPWENGVAPIDTRAFTVNVDGA